MKRNLDGTRPPVRVLLGVLVLLAYAAPGSAIYGVTRRAARRTTAVVVGTTSAAASSSAAASQQQAAAAQQQTAAAEQAAAQSAGAAQQAAAAAKPAGKTMQQKLEELQALYKQGLITESEYSAQKAKILAEGSQ